MRRRVATLSALALAALLVPATARPQSAPPPAPAAAPPPAAAPAPPPPGYAPPPPANAPPPPGYAPPPQPVYVQAPPQPVYVQAPPPKKKTIELTAFAGYQVNSDIYLSTGKLVVDDAQAWGAAISSEVRPGSFAELRWTYSDPKMHASGSSFNGSTPFHVQTHYFQIGGLHSVRRDRTTIFGGATIGAALFAPESFETANGKTYSLSDTWLFAFTLGLGFKVDITPKIGVRFDANVAAPVYFTSGGVYVGGGGAGLTVSGGVPIWQWNFLGGLVFSP